MKWDMLSQKYVPLFPLFRNKVPEHPATPVHVTVQSTLLREDRQLAGFMTRRPANTGTRTRERLHIPHIRRSDKHPSCW